MREFNDRRFFRKVFFSSASIVILAALLFLSVRGLIPIYERYSQARSLRKAAEERLAGLEERKKGLETALAEVESEQGFEREVRKRFGVVRPGEGVIEILDALVPENTAVKKRSFLERILDLF